MRHLKYFKENFSREVNSEIVDIVEDFLNIRLDFIMPKVVPASLIWDTYIRHDIMRTDIDSVAFVLEHETLTKDDIQDLEDIINKKLDIDAKVFTIYENLEKGQHIEICDRVDYEKLMIFENFFTTSIDESERLINQLSDEYLDVVTDTWSNYSGQYHIFLQVSKGDDPVSKIKFEFNRDVSRMISENGISELKISYLMTNPKQESGTIIIKSSDTPKDIENKLFDIYRKNKDIILGDF